MTIMRCLSLLARTAAIGALALTAAPTPASTPQSWVELDARSEAECSRLAGLADAKVGAPMRFGDDLGGVGIIDRSRATLVLGVDGSVSGNASCNAYSGRFTLDGTALVVSGLAPARARACAPSLLHQESRFLDVRGPPGVSSTGPLLCAVPRSRGPAAAAARSSAADVR